MTIDNLKAAINQHYGINLVINTKDHAELRNRNGLLGHIQIAKNGHGKQAYFIGRSISYRCEDLEKIKQALDEINTFFSNSIYRFK